MKMAVDGDRWEGTYSVECECGASWRGDAERSTSADWSPAAPLGCAVAHHRLHHTGQQADVRFTRPFASWLEAYWQNLTLTVEEFPF